MIGCLLHFLCLFAFPFLGTKCRQPRVRKEWRSLGAVEKADYIASIRCLLTSPAKGRAFFPVQTRYDDFVAVHINASGVATYDADGNVLAFAGPGIHFVGVFLPWHRYMLWLYETALQDECGYKGALPYWDWSLDTPENGGAQFNASPVFDPVTGFGGNGLGGSVPEIGSRPAGFVGIPSGGCVVDGPFADLKVILDPGPLPANGIIKASSGRCLRRNFQLDAANAALSWNANVVPLLNLTTFPEFTAGFDENVGKIGKYGNGVHSGGHFGIGGEMLNGWSSINDPLFYMHHANLDRIWGIWQDKTPANLYAIGGPIYPVGTGETTLETVVDMGEFLAPSVPVRKVMDPINRNGDGVLSYVYTGNGHKTI